MDAVIVRESLVCGMTDWVKIIAFHYAGEVFEYAFPVTSTSESETQAEAIALRKGFLLKAQVAFLRDIPDMETH